MEPSKPTIDSIIASPGEDDSASLTRAQWTPRARELGFVVSRKQGGVPRDGWRTSRTGVISYQIADADGGGSNHFTEDHPTLRLYSGPESRTYLNSAIESPALVVGALVLARSRSSDGWNDPDETLGIA